MVEIFDKSFGDRLAGLLSLAPDEGRTFTCKLPQGTFIVTVSPELTTTERLRYEMLSGSRSVHIEGWFSSFGINHQFSFDDRDGDGTIGAWDDGGIFDSAEFFVCENDDGMPHRFYRLLTEVIEDYLSRPS